MVGERETRNMELMSLAARMAVDELIGAGKKRYFNTPIGAFMRTMSSVFQSMNAGLFGLSCGTRQSLYGALPALSSLGNHLSGATHGLTPHVNVPGRHSPPLRLAGAL